MQISALQISVIGHRNSSSPCSSGLAVMCILVTASSTEMIFVPAAPPGHCSSTSILSILSGGGVPSTFLPGARADCSSDTQSGGVRWGLGPGKWMWHWHAGPQRFLKALKIISMCFSRSSRSKGRGWLVTVDMVFIWNVSYASMKLCMMWGEGVSAETVGLCWVKCQE